MKDEDKKKVRLTGKLTELSPAITEPETAETEKARLEKKLRENEQTLSSFMNSATDGFAIYDSQLNLVDINDAALEILPHGISKESILGKNILAIAPGLEETDRYKKYLEVIETGEPFFADDVIPHPEFGERHLAIRAFKVGEGLGITFTDITRHKQLQAAVRESERRFRSLVETTSDWVWEVDPNGIYTYSSPKIKDLLGYNPEEIIGKTPFDLMPPEEAKRIVKEFASIAKDKRSFERLENWNLHKDGHLVLLETSGVPILDEEGRLLGYRGIARDISERRKVEEALRQSEEKFRTFFESEPEYCYMISPDGAILDLNSAALMALGYDRQEIVGKPLRTIYAPESLPKVKQLFAKWKKTGHLRDEEMTIITKKGDRRVVLLSATAVRDDGGKIRSFVSVQRDITERKKAEEKKDELILQLQEALSSIKTLRGLLPICAFCKKIRDDNGYWNQLEAYVKDHSEADFTHGYCPECAAKLLAELDMDEHPEEHL